MADGYAESGFDLNGIIHSAYEGRGHNRRPSQHFHSRRHNRNGSRRRLQRAETGDDLLSVFDVPSPTVSQRRRSSISSARVRSRLPIDRRMWTEHENTPPTRELTDDQLYHVLNRYNQNFSSHGTLRLPSDVLNRRKSRFENEEFVPPDERRDSTDTAVAAGDSLGLSTSILRQRTHGRPEEEEPIAMGWGAENYMKLKDFYNDTTLLKKTLKRIQGRYGSAIMEYFSFVKWLVMLNIFITLMTLPIIVPQYLQSDAAAGNYSKQYNGTFKEISLNCTKQYDETLIAGEDDVMFYLYIADFIQGNGFMEKTALFYGHYSEKIHFKNSTVEYDMAIAFIVVVFVILLISFVVILWSLSSYHRQAMVNTGGSESKNKFSTAVLSGWDYGIVERSAVKIKKGLIKQELRQFLTDQLLREEFKNRTTGQIAGLWIARVIVNILVLATYVGCGYGIYNVQIAVEGELTKLSAEQGTARTTTTNTTQTAKEDTTKEALKLFYEYLPTAVITAIYLIIPNLFYIIVKLERYKPAVELSVTMARILFLRLFSLMFLLVTTMSQLLCIPSEENKCGNIQCGNKRFANGTTALDKCWETYLGQQIYKLVLLDFVVLLAVTYAVEYPRQFLYKKCFKTSFMKWLGQQEFDMPKNVMDALYNQTLCWIGVFFSPFIPLMITVKLFLFFWIKRGSLFANQRPSQQLSTASAVSSFFMWVMLFSLMIAYFVLIVYMQYISPSQSCGPFRIYYLTSEFKITDTLGRIIEGEEWITSAVEFIKSTPVVIVIFIILFLMWYFFVTLSNGLSAKEKMYIEQFTKAVKDRQFLYRQFLLEQDNAQTNNGMEARKSLDDANNNNNPETVLDQSEISSVNEYDEYSDIDRVDNQEDSLHSPAIAEERRLQEVYENTRRIPEDIQANLLPSKRDLHTPERANEAFLQSYSRHPKERPESSYMDEYDSIDNGNWYFRNRKFDGIEKKYKGVDRKHEGVDRKHEGVDRKQEGVDREHVGMDRKNEGMDEKYVRMDRNYERMGVAPDSHPDSHRYSLLKADQDANEHNSHPILSSIPQAKSAQKAEEWVFAPGKSVTTSSSPVAAAQDDRYFNSAAIYTNSAMSTTIAQMDENEEHNQHYSNPNSHLHFSHGSDSRFQGSQQPFTTGPIPKRSTHSGRVNEGYQNHRDDLVSAEIEQQTPHPHSVYYENEGFDPEPDYDD